MLLLLCVLNIYYAFVIMCTQYLLRFCYYVYSIFSLCFCYYVYSVLLLLLCVLNIMLLLFMCTKYYAFVIYVYSIYNMITLL